MHAVQIIIPQPLYYEYILFLFSVYLLWCADIYKQPCLSWNRTHLDIWVNMFTFFALGWRTCSHFLRYDGEHVHILRDMMANMFIFFALWCWACSYFFRCDGELINPTNTKHCVCKYCCKSAKVAQPIMMMHSHQLITAISWIFNYLCWVEYLVTSRRLLGGPVTCNSHQRQSGKAGIC